MTTSQECKSVAHKFFESCAADNDELRLLDGAHLIDGERHSRGHKDVAPEMSVATVRSVPAVMAPTICATGAVVARMSADGSLFVGAAGKQQRQRQKDGKNRCFIAKFLWKARVFI